MSAWRLGPLIVYDAVSNAVPRLVSARGFDPRRPDDALAVTLRPAPDRGDDWHAFPDDRVVGRVGPWLFAARPDKPSCHVLDLAGLSLSQNDREQLALAALNAVPLEETWKPPHHFLWLTTLAFVTATGERARRATPDDAGTAWRDEPLARHKDAAVLAAVLSGERSFEAAFETARALVHGQREAIASRSFHSCLLIEVIRELLTANSERNDELLRAVLCAGPRRTDVVALLERVTGEAAAEAERRARRREIAATGLEALPPFAAESG